MSDSLNDTGKSEVDVDKIMAEIRAEVAERHRKGYRYVPLHIPEAAPELAGDTQPVDLSPVRSAVALAETRADIGSEVTPMLRFRGLTRKLALFAGRIVLFLASFITDKQREFNKSIIIAFKGTIESLERQQQQLVSQQQQITSLRQELASAKDELSETKKRLSEATVVDVGDSWEVTGESYLEKALSRAEIPVKGLDQTGHGDLYYYLFENVFYDSEIIREKQKMYLQYINAELSGEHAFLDAGCGRGEFLTILKNNSIRAFGVDINSLEISDLNQRGFDVHCTDALAYLRSCTERFSGISALQVIEHLDRDYLKAFIESAYEKIEAGGTIILETVNPHSPYAVSNFYQDLTHRNPLPPEMMKFLLEWVGFRNIVTVYSSRVPEFARVLTDRRGGIDKRIYYQDYAVIGHKA